MPSSTTWVRKLTAQLNERWEEFSLAPDRFIDLGEQVLVLSHFHATGRDGIDVRLPFAHLWTMRNGRVVLLAVTSTPRDTARAMSHENVEIVRRMYELWSGRDWEGMAELADPDVEQHGTVGGLEEGHISRGVEQIMQRFEAENIEVWEEHRIEPVRFIDAGERVVVIQHEYQRGKGSGVEIEIDTATVFDVRGGRIARIQPYMNPAAALEAVGLPEQDAHAGT